MGGRIGKYIVTSTLGQGTFGKVKLGMHVETRVEYAIKILDKSDIAANDLTVNVRREIAIMKALSHRNIVNLREVLASRSKLYIVMDLVRGGELFEMIERRGGLDEKLARKYFQQLVTGVDYCHRRGVCHRDLKPENLLVDETGLLKITDFGVSSMKGTGGGSNGSIMYTAVGTPYYCAPEILNLQDEGEGYVGEQVDAWSCGIILYLLLTGTLPFHSENMVELFEQINSRQVSYAEHPWMPPDARKLISCLLIKDPSVRYSLDDVKKDPWFCVGFAPAESDSRQRSSGSSSGSSNSGAAPEIPITPSPRTPPGASSHNPPRARAPIESGVQSIARQAPTSALKDLVHQYNGRELADLIRDAMPGKPLSKVSEIVSKLEAMDIDCVEDMQFVAKDRGNPESLTAWLEDKSTLQAVTCMRVAHFFFS